LRVGIVNVLELNLVVCVKIKNAPLKRSTKRYKIPRTEDATQRTILQIRCKTTLKNDNKNAWKRWHTYLLCCFMYAFHLRNRHLSNVFTKQKKCLLLGRRNITLFPRLRKLLEVTIFYDQKS
jgi:hypothetical protein